MELGMNLEDRIASLVATQPEGASLRQEFYADPAIFERDLDRMLLRHWLCAGHESSVQQPGDFFLFEIAAESVIIARGQDALLRALVNVCRHRGSRICREAGGRPRTSPAPITLGVTGSTAACAPPATCPRGSIAPLTG
jgi:hypothetical protein